MITMYILTFVVSQSVIRVVKSHACIHKLPTADLEITVSSAECFEDAININPDKTIVAFITMMTMLTGTLAPKMLLHIRKEYYTYNEPSNSKGSPPALRTIMWQVALPSDTQESNSLLQNTDSDGIVDAQNGATELEAGRITPKHEPDGFGMIREEQGESSVHLALPHGKSSIQVLQIVDNIGDDHELTQ
ncbi:hypothetical protein SCHPADRAFT_268386 [Schizopora paradoxa]|uniref:Uncharacterized protein n=1 Tax=Schizopora paradoxa TaxID=27342 RepID=A0A0H2SE25_9AGAM|nr:hypothetical protein SCHPADRAFT_268386 [Schizopora paradoxa]